MAPSMHALPLVICNMGCEMVYILEQRLRAQSIKPDKAVKVLDDVSRAMFDASFVDELFRPQEMYTESSLKHVFTKLAHASIMRLSESSMGKLFDLMTMGFKYQLTQCLTPTQIVDVTLTHVVTVRSYLTDESVIALLDAFEAKCRDLYGRFTVNEWIDLRADLHDYLKDYRVKVSLFLQAGVQKSDGSFCVPTPKSPDSPYGVGPNWEGEMMADPPTLGVPLGGNAYSKDKQAPRPPAPLASASSSYADAAAAAKAAAEEKARAAAAEERLRRSETVVKGNADEMARKAGKEGAKELNHLLGLIQPPKVSDDFKLNLFGDGPGLGGAVSFGDVGGGAGASGDANFLGKARPRSDYVEISADSRREADKASGLSDVMKSFSVNDSGGGGTRKGGKAAAAADDDDEDDLLALMDAA